MSGPAAPLSPLGATHNLVVEWTPAEDADWGDVDVALRRGLVKVAAHLAEAALEAEPDAVEELAEPGGAGSDVKPRVGVILNLQTQGKFKDVFVYGRSLSGGLPTVISPCGRRRVVGQRPVWTPALKNPTILHQTHRSWLPCAPLASWKLAGSSSAPIPHQAERTRLVARPRLCGHLGLDAARAPRRAAATPTPTSPEADTSRRRSTRPGDPRREAGRRERPAARCPPTKPPPSSARATTTSG